MYHIFNAWLVNVLINSEQDKTNLKKTLAFVAKFGPVASFWA